VTFNPEGSLLAVMGGDATVRLRRVSDGSIQHLIKMEPSRSWLAKLKVSWPKVIYSVAFSLDGDLLALGGGDATVRLWRVSDGSLLQKLGGYKGWVWSVPVSFNGRTAKYEPSSSHKGSIRSMAFSPDGSLLASGGDDTTMRLWQVSDGSLLQTLEGRKGSIQSVAFSPDGSLLASGRDDTTVRLWHVSDGSLVRTLEGHEGAVFSMAFSPEGSLLASGGNDKTVRLWTIK
jgi:WD40 repeat protein